jgi:hypothetical protein
VSGRRWYERAGVEGRTKQRVLANQFGISQFEVEASIKRRKNERAGVEMRVDAMSIKRMQVTTCSSTTRRTRSGTKCSVWFAATLSYGAPSWVVLLLLTP